MRWAKSYAKTCAVEPRREATRRAGSRCRFARLTGAYPYPMKRKAKRSGIDAPRPAARSPKARAGQTSSAPSVEIRRHPDYITAVMAGPEGNHLNAAMATALIELAHEVEDDEAVKLLVVSGADGAFCSGFDDDVDPQVVETLAALAKPTVALIDGDALDEGLELAMALDIRAAVAGAHFGLRQLACGTLPRFGGTQRLPRLVGAAQALRMILTGAVIDGRRAMESGLVTYLAEAREQFSVVAGQLIESITSRGPIAARLVKEAVVKGFDMTLGQGIRLEEDLYALLQTTEDRAEGVRSFLEKRKPLFKGI
jgi:enoyl-CoA hydratase/carnithine racemase